MLRARGAGERGRSNSGQGKRKGKVCSLALGKEKKRWGKGTTPLHFSKKGEKGRSSK